MSVERALLLVREIVIFEILDNVLYGVVDDVLGQCITAYPITSMLAECATAPVTAVTSEILGVTV